MGEGCCCQWKVQPCCSKVASVDLCCWRKLTAGAGAGVCPWLPLSTYLHQLGGPNTMQLEKRQGHKLEK